MFDAISLGKEILEIFLRYGFENAMNTISGLQYTKLDNVSFEDFNVEEIHDYNEL